jgi:hypothetical protein
MEKYKSEVGELTIYTGDEYSKVHHVGAYPSKARALLFRLACSLMLLSGSFQVKVN